MAKALAKIVQKHRELPHSGGFFFIDIMYLEVKNTFNIRRRYANVLLWKNFGWG